MSVASSLPASAVRLYRSPSEVNLEGIATPGQKATATEMWQCLRSDLTAFLNVVIGSIEVVGGYGGAVARRVPLRHPEYPFLLATGARSKCKGVLAGSGTGAAAVATFWKYADVQVSFSSMPYDISGQNAFLSRSGSPSSRPIPGSAAGFRLGANPPPFDIDDGVEGEEFTYTTHQLPTLPIAVYDGVRNCVNDGTFVGRPLGTVLYRGPQYNQTAQFDGSQSWEVTHQFSYSKVPWNSYYTPLGTVAALTRADGSLKYPLADLTQVFSANG